MVSLVVPLEPHRLDPAEAFCPRCCDWTALATLTAVADGATLFVRERYVSVTCGCGWAESYLVSRDVSETREHPA